MNTYRVSTSLRQALNKAHVLSRLFLCAAFWRVPSNLQRNDFLFSCA